LQRVAEVKIDVLDPILKTGFTTPSAATVTAISG